MRIFFLASLFFLSSLYAYPPLPQASSVEEALFIRRIVNFWRDQEYFFVKDQILSYLQKNPKGTYADHFNAMLGDIAVHEKEYSLALEYYGKVAQKEMKSEVQTKKWQTLYLMGAYEEIYQEVKPIIDHVSDDEKFYFAESALRKGLALLRESGITDNVKSLFDEALPVYASLQNQGTYSSHAKLAMAEIFRALDMPKEAAAFYLKLSEEKNDDAILFHAAASLVQYDTKKAMEIFELLASKGHHEASFHLLELLVKYKKWDRLEKEREFFLSNLDDSARPLAFFYFGMLAFEKQNYLQATLDFSKAIEKGLTRPHEKTCLLALMKCASETEKLEICEKAYLVLEEGYPENVHEGKFILAGAYEKKGQYQKALILFDALTNASLETELSEKAFCGKARVLAAQKDWKKAHEVVSLFLNKFPHSPMQIKMASLAVELACCALGDGDMYQKLIVDIERGLSLKAFENTYDKQLLLARAYLKTDKVDEALNLLEALPTPNFLLLTECYIKKGGEPEKIIAAGEKALLENPECAALHFHLFNAYLALAKEKEDEKNTHFAARHLDAVIDTHPVSIENFLWLARFHAKEGNVRAIYLLEPLMRTEAGVKRFDEEALILAELYQRSGEEKKAETLLEKVLGLKQQTAARARLLLADLYVEMGEETKAKEHYFFLQEHPTPCIACQAKLQLARLSFCEEPEKCLRKLHDLSVRKALTNEPVHFEAAIDLAEFKTASLSEAEKDHALLGEYLRIKEEFTEQNTICSRDYHAARKLLPDKERIYQAYMRYLDARIYSLESKLIKDPAEKKIKEAAGRALFITLKQGKYAVSPYLIKKVKSQIHEEL